MAFSIDELTGDRRFLQASPDKQRAMLEAYTQSYGGPGLADALGSVTPADRRPGYGTAPQTAIDYGETESFGGGSGSGGFMRQAAGTTMKDFQQERGTLGRGSGVVRTASGKMYRVDPDYEYDVQHRTSDPDLRAAVPGIAEANQKRQAGLSDLLQRQQGGAAAAKALEELAATRNAVLLNETMMSPEEQEAALSRLDQAEARWMAVLGGGAGPVAPAPEPAPNPAREALQALLTGEGEAQKAIPRARHTPGMNPAAAESIRQPRRPYDPTSLSDTLAYAADSGARYLMNEDPAQQWNAAPVDLGEESGTEKAKAFWGNLIDLLRKDHLQASLALDPAAGRSRR